MHLAYRIISEYTGNDILLGIYSNLEMAKSGMRKYIKDIQSGVAADNFSKQAYRESNLVEDCQIFPDLVEIGITGNEKSVYLVSEYGEGMGQSYRKFLAICASKTEAEKFIEKADKEDENPWPVDREIECYEVDRPLYEKSGA